MDLFDRVRHWLIRKLSCGDMILINAEIHSGRWRQRNAGPALVSGLQIREWSRESAIAFGSPIGDNAAISFMRGARDVTLKDCIIDMQRPSIKQ